MTSPNLKNLYGNFKCVIIQKEGRKERRNVLESGTHRVETANLFDGLATNFCTVLLKWC